MNELDALEAQLLRKARRRKLILALVGVAAILSIILPCVYVGTSIGGAVVESHERREAHDVEYGHSMTPEQARAIDEALRSAELSLETRNAAWHRSFAKVFAEPVEGRGPRFAGIGEETSPCPYRLPLRPPNSASRHGSFNNLDDFEVFTMPGGQVFPWAAVHKAAGQLPNDAPRVEAARQVIQRLRNLDGSQNSLDHHVANVESAEALASTFWSYDVLILADTYRRPIATALGSSFTPGSVDGLALLYNYAEERVVCAATIHAETTSVHVDYTAQQFNESSTLQMMLSRELDAEIERAVARALRNGGAIPVPAP